MGLVKHNASLATLIINFLAFLIIYQAALAAAPATKNVATAASGPDNRPENVTVFLKSWPFRLVQKECESSFLYDYGYTSVLVSSIQDKSLLKGSSASVADENFQFDDLFKFRTPLGTVEEFAGMIKSCEKNGIKVYVSLKLITDKQIDQVIKKYEEIEPFLLRKLAQRIAKSRAAAAKSAPNTASPAANPSKKADITAASDSQDRENSPHKPVRFDENFMKKRQHKNTKYLMELVLLNAASAANTSQNAGISSLMQSFKQVDKEYRLRYKRNKVLSENSAIPGLVRKYCKLKYKLEDISSAVKFVRYLAELGVSGVRIENAAYIDTKALNEIFTSAQKQIAHKMTLIFDDVINVKHYQKFGSVMDEKYARNLMSAVKGVNFKKLVSKKKIWPLTWRNIASSEKSRPFVPKYMLPEDNKDDAHNFKIATAMMLANPYGSPIVVSPYSRLKKRIRSLPNADAMEMKDICSKGKFCIHRKKFIRQLVLFRLITADDKITSIQALRNNIIYLNRGNKGFAAFIHRTPPSKDKRKPPENLSIQTELPPGLYCNIITGYPDLKRGRCNAGSVVQVNLKRRVYIKNVHTYRKGVLAIDILSRLKYMDIKADGKYVFQTKPSSPKQVPGKGQITGSNYKARDLDDLQEQRTANPTPISPPTSTIPGQNTEHTSSSESTETRDSVDIVFADTGEKYDSNKFVDRLEEKFLAAFKSIARVIVDFIHWLRKRATNAEAEDHSSYPIHTRDLGDVLGHNKFKVELNFGGFGKIFKNGLEFIEDVVKKFLKFVEKLVEHGPFGYFKHRKYPHYVQEHYHH